MAYSSVVKPTLNVLSPEQIEQTHKYTLEILSTVGFRVDSEQARHLFTKAEGAKVEENGRVFLNPELVEWSIQSAPSSIDIYDRLGNHAFRLGDDRTRFGVGVTNIYYQDPETDDVTQFTRQHMESSVRLAHALNNFDVVSTIGIIQDYSPDVADLFAALEMVANTTKPLVMLVSDENLFPDVLGLLTQLHDDLASRPFVIPYFNPVTPLILNEGTADKMIESIEHGLPLIFSNYSMAGMSTPITPAGTLAILNAELLAGLVLSQLVKEGAPIILGSLPIFFDMRTMLDYFDPLTFLLNLACAEIMTHYQIPHAGTSGSGVGLASDIVASGALWANQITSSIGKVGLAPFVGSSLGSKAFSPSLTVYANEVIDQSLRFSRGFSLSDETIGMNDIAQAGPGGSFVTAELTLKMVREMYYSSDIFPRISLETWQSQGNPTNDKHLQEYTRHLMNSVQAPEDHAELVAKGEIYIKKITKGLI